MELKVEQKYKQTDVGVIPNDWQAKKISTVCKLINGRGFKPYEWRDQGLPIIRIQNLNGSDEYNYYQGTYDPKIEIAHDELLFAWSGSKGTSFGPHIWKGQKGLLNYHTWKIKVDVTTIDKTYFLYCLRNLTAKIEDKAHGASALVHTQKGEMENFEFPFTADKKEQTAIASALSDTDALITSLEKLIAKKRDIKQAAMQELLRPNERWDFKKLGELFEITSSKRVFQKDWRKEGVPFYRARELAVLGEHGWVDNELFIDRDMYWQYRLQYGAPQIGDMLVTGVGTLGKVYEVVNTHEFYFKDGNIIWFKINGSLETNYLKQLYSTPFITNQIANASAGTTVGTYTITGAKNTIIPVPPREEQVYIGKVLSDMDKEIERLEDKLAKFKEIKQGMMQVLLTGKVRLV